MQEHIVPRRTYLLVTVALLALTALTAGASMVDLGPWNLVIALGIAVAKASLVVLFFMHAKYNGGLNWIVLGAGLLWLGILLVGTLDDLLTRGWIPIPGK